MSQKLNMAGRAKAKNDKAKKARSEQKPDSMKASVKASIARSGSLGNTLRDILVAQGAVSSRQLNHRIRLFIEQISLTIDTKRWEIDYKNHTLPELIRTIDRAIELLESPPNAYQIAMGDLQIYGHSVALTRVCEARDLILPAAMRERTFIKEASAVMEAIDAFLRETTGDRLNQKKMIILNRRGKGDQFTGTFHPSFAYTAILALAPHAKRSEIATALKNYIIARNKREGIPSHGFEKGKKRKKAASS